MRNVLVTGGSRGLGLGIARTLAESGFQVVALARKDSDALAAARDRVVGGGRGALHFRACDLGDVEGLGGLVKSLRAEFGPFYGLVNNAGIGTAGHPGDHAGQRDRAAGPAERRLARDPDEIRGALDDDR